MKRIIYKIEWRERHEQNWKKGRKGVLVKHEFKTREVNFFELVRLMEKCEIEDFKIIATWEEERSEE